MSKAKASRVLYADHGNHGRKTGPVFELCVLEAHLRQILPATYSKGPLDVTHQKSFRLVKRVKRKSMSKFASMAVVNLKAVGPILRVGNDKISERSGCTKKSLKQKG